MALVLTVGIALADWLSTPTERLYLDDNSVPNQQVKTATQSFTIVGSEVRPQITTRDNAHVAFPVSFTWPQKLVFKVKPSSAASYQIYLRNSTSRRLIASEAISKSKSRSIWIVRCVGTLEFVGQGAITWTDVRLVRAFCLWPIYAIAIVALVLSILNHRAEINPRSAELFTLTISTLIALGLAECFLRAFAHRLPPVVAAARYDLGFVGADSRLIDPKRYNQRVRPNLDTYFEWRYGDIVRWGIVPQSASRGALHRYPFRTDSEGFRNIAVRTKIDVAALGDSFTDAATSPIEESWPAQLEKITGSAVQNFGVSGFGPQQELYALEDFALPRNPKWAVLAFFGGNDLHEAEAFDQWEKAGRPTSQEMPGWKLIKSFRRYQTQYSWTLASLAIDSIHRRAESRRADLNTTDTSLSSPAFQDGYFTTPVAGKVMRFAFMPYYLQRMATPRSELKKSRGWEITQSVLRKMHAECEAKGIKLLVMLVPSKEQAYWPSLAASVATSTVKQALDYYGQNQQPEDLLANRLELNLLARDFCIGEGIPVLDLTPVFQQKFESGFDCYFSDDSHWNAAGHKVAAEELAAFFQRQRP